jgi:hypothetical protein
MEETPARRGPFVPDRYYARRRLTSRELLPAVGTAVGVGLSAFYLAKVWMERVVLDEFEPAAAPPAPKHTGRPGRSARESGRR